MKIDWNVERGWSCDFSQRKNLLRQTRFPVDLRLWLESPALLRLAQSVAHEHAAGALQPSFLFASGRSNQPWRLLSLVTYALACGVGHPDAVAEVGKRDSDLLEWFQGQSPSAEIIRRFRNQNRMPILKCLEVILRRLWCHRHVRRAATLPDLIVVEILCEARMRVQRAELLGQMHANGTTGLERFSGRVAKDTHARV